MKSPKVAMITCENSRISVKDCFPDVSKPIISRKIKEEKQLKKLGGIQCQKIH